MSSAALNAQVDSDWLPMFLLFIILEKKWSWKWFQQYWSFVLL